MAISVIISINEDIVQIHNNEDVKFLSKDLVDVFLEACWCICLIKKHHLVLKVAISSFKRCFLLVSFANFYLMICTGKVKLDELSNPS